MNGACFAFCLQNDGFCGNGVAFFGKALYGKADTRKKSFGEPHARNRRIRFRKAAHDAAFVFNAEKRHSGVAVRNVVGQDLIQKGVGNEKHD